MSLSIQFEGLSNLHDCLIDDYKTNQAPHALLLSGVAGLLKVEFAEFLAKSLLCSSANHLRPCGQCSACRQTKNRQHPNLFYLQAQEGSKTIKIEQLRSLIGSLSLNPIETGRRVIVILQIETMTIHAQNALLKSLEEPQSCDYYLVTCNNERNVLPTIISRCRFVRLPHWSDDQVYRLLIKNHLDHQRAIELSRLSQGRPGLALKFEDDQQYWQTKDLAINSFFSIKTLKDIPSASLLLKDAKDKGDLLLNIIELEVQTVLHHKYLNLCNSQKSYWEGAHDTAMKNMLQAIFEARKYKSSNVSWQAIADRLLFSIIKEIY